jgi:hypothetical protein
MLRDATDGDRDTVLGWRNHPRVRRSSFTAHEIGEAEHSGWWAAVRADPARWLLIYEHGGAPSGVVTFALADSGTDPGTDSGVADWGFYLDVAGLEGRGELLPAWIGIERDSIAYAFDKIGATVLRGDVLAANAAVWRLHRRCGFTETARYVRAVDGVPHEVVRVELRSGDRR